jgi:DNA-directed RNA polymerase specialized sigma24 family protein
LRCACRKETAADTLEHIPAEERQDAIANALDHIAEKERRASLLAKINDLNADELQRLVG